MELEVSRLSRGDDIVLVVAGEIDLYTAPRLQRELAAAVGDGDPGHVVVDMSGVEFCDSTGMNVLLAAHWRATERGGSLELAAPRPSVRKILQVTGLDTVFLVQGPAPVPRQ